jgi:hypothetical protein
MLAVKNSKRGRKSKKQIQEEKEVSLKASKNEVDNSSQEEENEEEEQDSNNKSSVYESEDIEETKETEVTETEKPKKKRGRKPKPKTEEDEQPKVPKKRGRKPKPKSEEEIDKAPKKRGRKPKEKTYSVIQNNYRETLEEIENENIIVHIPITSNDIEAEDHSMQVKDILQYNPNIQEPLPYEPDNAMQSNYEIISTKLQEKLKDDDKEVGFQISSKLKKKLEDLNEANEETEQDPYSEMTDEIVKKDLKINTINDCDKCGLESPNDNYVQSIKKTKIHEIMYEFINASDNNEWPTQTNIACFWCCHKFSSMPVGIPNRIVRKKFNLWGCFCSYNCAAAHIFYNKVPNMWEKYSLLNLFYAKVNKCKSVKIKLAPPRESLQMFGGNMGIEDFRQASLKTNVVYRIIEPPIVSIIPQLEEIQLENMNRRKANTLLVNEYGASSQTDSNLKLRRDKPLSNRNNTLENYMQLKIV